MRYRRSAALAAAVVVLWAGAAPVAHADRGKDPWILGKIASMSLEEKVGQLFVADVYGESGDTTAPADVAANQAMYGPDVRNGDDLVAKYKLGAILYFRWANNLNDPVKVAGLSNDLQRAALAQPARIPLLLATDQEHGAVYRLDEPFTAFPGQMALGATRSAALALAAGTVTGRELAALGINQDYAPVADVNTNPGNPVIGVRSFGEDAGLVSDLTRASVRGLQLGGVSATMKHFPGHGDTVTDSHTGVPWIFHTKEQWRRIDAPPFRAGIAAGADMIMTAHVVMPHLQSDCDVETQEGCDPATLDPEIMTGLLRGELGFDGVVVTDSLAMQGVRDKYGDDRVPVLALKAGVDMVMIVDDTASTMSLDVAYNAVLNAVRTGELTEERIDESVYRVLRLKKKRGLFRGDQQVNEGQVPGRVGTPAHRALARVVADHSVTLVRNDAGALPLTGTGRVLVTGYRNVTPPSVKIPPAERLAAAIAGRGVTTELFETGTAPTPATVAAAVAKAGAADAVVVATVNSKTSAAQRDLVNALLATGKPVVIVAARNPYDIADFPGAPAYLATYSWEKPAMEAAARVLFGQTRPTGRLPVTIPAADGSVLYPYGHGLRYRLSPERSDT
ncbi:glycoside hydrolase family 3 protein [Sphaerisporangium sp. TRM90804]|uniref:glycoside hydrolase family 3 protein n=1 Tax=Sphaerisporangium sp. TRM90804 TaxID=3031113 RepID=UPI002448D363|nr:glycoside hydrolase family 3 protein [Sphaerisporangium sp. TRM90804]MDH2428426.1 glycoside hydrolase family 3 N-terminal domain-containing protein [Sphaerisporangium sp. TRM90804]